HGAGGEGRRGVVLQGPAALQGELLVVARAHERRGDHRRSARPVGAVTQGVVIRVTESGPSGSLSVPYAHHHLARRPALARRYARRAGAATLPHRPPLLLARPGRPLRLEPQ